MTAVFSRTKKDAARTKITESLKPEIMIVLAYVILYCIISAFHEPWFDEAQSWQIAKCESIRRLLFFIPHYEGNPPLWYLILAIPAKLGVPFEVGLKTVGLIISFCYVLLIEFKSPFPRPIKLILPFTFFLFYQYGIIVRPYGLMVIAFILVSITFKERNKRPWIFVLSLAILCETSSFCVVVAGGIAACWLFEVLQEDFAVQKIIKDARIYALLVLLVYALILVMTILPPADASFTRFLEGENSVFKCFFVALSTALSETLFFTSPWFSDETLTLSTANIMVGPLIAGIVIQLIIIVHIVCFSNKKNLKYFVVPYCCYCLFGAAVVLAGHYLGVGYCIFLFWLWISCADDRQFEMGISISRLLNFSDRDKALLKKFSALFIVLSLGITFIWTVTSALQEIRYQYSYGRETYRFLYDTGLINTKIAMTWDEGSSESNVIDYDEMDTKSNGWPVPLCAYANRNIVYNFNDGADDAAYVQFIKQTSEQNRDAIKRWKEKGIPDVLLGEVDVELLTDGAVTIKDYTPVYEMELNYVWKGRLYKGRQYIFVRNDLIEKYSLTPIERPEGMYGNSGFYLTDEMRERYENGEDINDILKPYLDNIFGEEE